MQFDMPGRLPVYSFNSRDLLARKKLSLFPGCRQKMNIDSIAS